MTDNPSRAQIIPENVHINNPRYAPDTWDYPRRCADIELALDATRERIEEWDRDGDPHGWWHERPLLIALHNEVVRLRERERWETRAPTPGYLAGNTDAYDWAKSFTDMFAGPLTIKGAPSREIDGQELRELMLAWFAGAIESGRDASRG